MADLSLRKDTTEGEREILVLLGVDGRERGVLKGVRAGEESSRRVFVVPRETLPFLNFSLRGVVTFVADLFTDVSSSIEGIAMSGSRSIFLA